MHCSKCGADNIDGSAFCIKCGAPLTASIPGGQPYSPAPPYQSGPTYPQSPPYPVGQPAYPQAPPYPVGQPVYPQATGYQRYYSRKLVPGSGLLKTASILFLVYGGLIALIAVLFLIADTYFETSAIIGFVLASVVPIAIGIYGLIKCTVPSAALYFIISGAIFFPLTIACIVLMQNIDVPGMEVRLYPGVLALALPVLYIIGGAQLNRYSRSLSANNFNQ